MIEVTISSARGDASMKRKIVQIAAVPETEEEYGAIYALADDGTLWRMTPLVRSLKSEWERIEPLPDRQPGEPE